MFTTSSKGNSILVADGHEFFKKREGNSTTTWNCSRYQKLKCRATATTIAEHVLDVRGEHILETKFGKAEARRVKTTFLFLRLLRSSLKKCVNKINVHRKRTLRQCTSNAK